MSFAEDIKKFTDKVAKKAETTASDIGDELLVRIKNRTPVGSGRLRDSWTKTVTDSKVLITTNVEYAPIVEYGLYPNPPKEGQGKTTNGFSTQSPAGMVGITAVEYPQVVKEVVAK